jgi:hypothetical protein
VSGPLVAAALLVVTGLLLWTWWRKCRLRAIRSDCRNFAQAHPHLWLGFAVLFLLAAMMTSKVLSPQYLLWLLPLVPLLAVGRPEKTRAFLWAFVAVCGVTTLLFPMLYFTHLVIVVSPERGEIAAPTILGVAVLAVRNLILVGLTAGLVLAVWRQASAGREGVALA